MGQWFSNLHMPASKLQTLLFSVESLMNPNFLQAAEAGPRPPDDAWGQVVSFVAKNETMKLVDKRTYAQITNDNIRKLLPVLKGRYIRMYKDAGFFCVRPNRPTNAVLLFDDMNIERHSIIINLGPPLTIEIAIRTPEEEDFDEGSFKQISGISSMRQFKSLLYSLHLNSEISIPPENVKYGDYIQNDPAKHQQIKDINRQHLLKWLNANFGDEGDAPIESRDRYIHDMFDISQAKIAYIKKKMWNFEFYSVEYATNDSLTVDNDTEQDCITLTTHSQNVHPDEPDNHRTHKMKFTNIHSVGKLVHLMRSRQYWNGSYPKLKEYPGAERLPD